MAKKPILVTVTKTKHKGAQKYKVRIEGGKSDMEIPQRFTTAYSAKRGALRKLKAEKDPYFSTWYSQGRAVNFINK